ncbi:MAG: AAA family ATPase [Chamaesiphon sp.]|nr:AAA family ATPase [Chamaesiphon sp.]
MEEVKEEIRLKIIYPLTHAEMYRAYGKSIGGGILLYGPPGCGKTHLARATAGEIQAEFISVGLNDILDSSPRAVRSHPPRTTPRCRRSCYYSLFYKV